MARRRTLRSRGPIDVIDNEGFEGNKVTQIQRGVTPFAARFVGRLRYFERVTVSTTSSVNTANTYSFRLNSLYDPNYTGTGHQPYQFDQLSPIYNNYLVTRADFKVTVIPDFATQGLQAGLSVFTDTNVSDSASGKTLSELKEKAVTQVRPIATEDNQKNYPVFRAAIDMARAFGVPKATYLGDQNFAAQTSANPSRTLYAELCIVDPGANPGSSTWFDVEITYHTNFWGYKGPAQS